MSDFQRIVDDVRSSLHASGSEAAETVRAAAIAYGEACGEVNERLRRCNELLKAGLRSEAIQQCEISPNLLDVVATLDFPERDYWVQLLNQHGISASGPLLMDVAADLNEAYAIEQPLETLLDRHRILALARSPLNLRINTLRKLTEVDTHNPIWREDLLVFERERQKELQREASNAVAAGDAVAIAKLEKELQSSKWLETPPATLVRWVSDARGKLSGRQARIQLEQIEAELNKAYAEFDDYNGRRLREQWKSLVPMAGLQEGEPLWQRAAPALEWLAQQDAFDNIQIQFATAIESLEEGLNSRRPAPTLERLYLAVCRHEQEIPERLDARYHKRLADLQAVAAKRKRKVLIGISSAVLIIVCIAGGIILHNLHVQEVEQNAAALKKLIDENKLSEADQFLSKIKTDSPSILSSTEFNDLSARLAGLLKKESDRRESFALAIQNARQAVNGAIDWASLAQARGLNSDAKKLSRDDAEKDEVKRLEQKLASIEHELQKKENDRFVMASESLHKRLVALEENKSGSPPQQRISAIDNLRTDIKALQQSSVNVSFDMRQQSDTMLKQLGTLEDALQSEQRAVVALQEISRKIGDPIAFRQAISDYAADHPTASQSADFVQAVSEASLWADIGKNSELAKSWRQQNHQQIDAKSALALVVAARDILQKQSASPDASAYLDRVSFLEAVSRRINDKGEDIQANLITQFSKPWVKDFWVVEQKDGTRYYCKVQPEIGTGPFSNIRYVSDFDLSEKKTSIHSDDAQIALAPQNEIAKLAVEHLHQLQTPQNKLGWEQGFSELAQSIHDSEKIDPLLRFNLLQQTLDIGCNGSKCLDIAYASQRKMMNEAGINIFANWLDPADKDARTARSKAEEVLRGLPDFSKARRQAADLWQSLSQPVGRSFVWVGWLQHNTNGKWECNVSLQDKRTGDLFIARRGTSDSLAVDRVGHLSDGKVELTLEVKPGCFVEGRPVYLVETSSAK